MPPDLSIHKGASYFNMRCFWVGGIQTIVAGLSENSLFLLVSGSAIIGADRDICMRLSGPVTWPGQTAVPSLGRRSPLHFLSVQPSLMMDAASLQMYSAEQATGPRALWLAGCTCPCLPFCVVPAFSSTSAHCPCNTHSPCIFHIASTHLSLLRGLSD